MGLNSQVDQAVSDSFICNAERSDNPSRQGSRRQRLISMHYWMNMVLRKGGSTETAGRSREAEKASAGRCVEKEGAMAIATFLYI